MTRSNDLRRHPRRRAAGRIALSWVNAQGAPCMTHGECVNISPAGVAVRLRDPLERLSQIGLRSAVNQLNGTGSVRYCLREKVSWMIGIEFVGGLTWRPA